MDLFKIIMIEELRKYITVEIRLIKKGGDVNLQNFKLKVKLPSVYHVSCV